MSAELSCALREVCTDGRAIGLRNIGHKVQTTLITCLSSSFPPSLYRRAANTGQDAAAVLNASVVAPGAASGQQPPAPSPTDWVQAYDASSGHFYYYCSALQLTQWEAPEAFVPLDLRGWPPFEGTHTRFDDEGRPLQSSADTPEASTSGHRGASDTTGAFAGARAPCAPAVPSWRQERTDACCSEEHGQPSQLFFFSSVCVDKHALCAE